jgi:Arylsulfotransferase (ASST)
MPVLWSTGSVVSVQAAPGPGNEDGILVTGSVTSITSSPMPALQMSPPFMQSIHDYVIHCTSASNAITFTVVAAGGTTTVTRTLVENQPEIVQGSGAPYWIRCLPRDFPPITAMETPAGVSAGLSGYYLTGSITTPAVPPWPVAFPTAYAMILDTNGTPVWYQPANYGSAVGATNVELLPNDTLAWSPINGPGVGATPGVGYRLFNLDTQTTLPQPSPVQPPDLHELLQLPNGDRMELATPLVNCGTSPACPFGRSTFFPTVTNHSYVDCVVQEVGPSGNLVWSWDAKDHVSFMENKLQNALPIGNGNPNYADVYHCNSIDVDPASHDVLVSLRDTSAVYRINRATKKIVWKLSGADTPGMVVGDQEPLLTISGDPDTPMTISGQHDARFQSGGDVSLFDDHSTCASPSTCPMSGAARGVEYHIVNTAMTHTATLNWHYEAPDVKPSAATGSFRRYAGNDNVIGWGFHGLSTLMMSEVNNDVPPKPLLTFSFPEGLYEYRFLKLQQLPFDINLLRQTAGLPHPSSAPRSVHFAKLDGAGSGSSAVEVSDSSIWLEKNLGNNTFGPPQLGATNGPFFGNVGTYLADLDGAGHASAIAVNTTDVWIEHDVGADIFAQPMQAVGGAPFFGNVGTYVADLDGSGKASVIAVNTTDTWIEHNRGNDTFGPPQQVASGGRFFGSVGTYVADLDGTGKASVIAVNGNNVWIEKNQGNDTFGSPQSAGGSLFSGGVGTYVADIGVSGQASLLAVNSNSIWLENNQGNDTFGGPQPAAGNSPFYGTH